MKKLLELSKKVSRIGRDGNFGHISAIKSAKFTETMAKTTNNDDYSFQMGTNVVRIQALRTH